MDACIRPEGWHNWNSREKEGSACFYEYKCFGPGSNTSGRVNWARQLKDGEIGQYVSQSFIDPDEKKAWLANKISMRIPVTA
jgi:pectinesterase